MVEAFLGSEDSVRGNASPDSVSLQSLRVPALVALLPGDKWLQPAVTLLNGVHIQGEGGLSSTGNSRAANCSRESRLAAPVSAIIT